MPPSLILDISASFALGISAGVLSNLFGVGGGVLFITFLPYLGFSEISSVATSLAIVCLIALTNAVRFHKLNLISWQIVFRIIPFALIFSFIATMISLRIDVFSLKIIFAIVITSFFIFSLKPMNIAFIPYQWNIPGKIKSIFVGGLTGGITGFTGLGAGGIISFLLLSWKVTGNQNVVPTTNAIMVFTTFVAGLMHFSFLKNFRPDIIIIIFLSSQIAGAYLGKRQKKLSNTTRHIGLACIFGIIALKAWLTL